jgi:hypothetical protein
MEGKWGRSKKLKRALQANKTATVFQPWPMFWEAAKMSTSRVVFRASTP